MSKQSDYYDIYNSMLEAFDNVQISYFVVDLVYDDKGNPIDFIYRDVSRATELLIGKSRQQLIGKSRRELFGNVTDEFPLYFHEVLKTGKPAHFQSYGDALKKFYDVYAWKSTQNQVAVLLTDITEHKKIEEALKESEEKYRRLFTNMIDGFAFHKMILDKDGNSVDYVFIEINEAFTKITGLGKDIVGKKVTEAIPNIEKDVTDWIGIYGKVASTCQPIKFESYSKELQKWFLVSSYCIQRGHFAAIFEDITERKTSEEIIKENEARLNMAQQMGHLGSWEFLIKENKAFWSEELFRIFNLEPQTYGPNLEEYRKFIHPDDLDRVTKIAEKTTYEGHLGELSSFDYRIVSASGLVRILHTERVVKEVDESGKPSKIMGIEQDITEHRLIEQRLEQYNKHLEELVEERTKQLRDAERLATIGQTAGMVGHDIRNPLQAAVNELYFARQAIIEAPAGSCNEGTLESLNVIQEQIDYISKIVSDLQDYAKPLQPNLVDFDLCNFIPNALKTLPIPNTIQVVILCEDNVPQVRIDSTFTRRILTNLVNNAVQAMPGGGKLTITVRKKEDQVLVIVEDTGVGIADDVKPRIFSPLFTTKAKGQGFGLPVVKRLVEALGGTISFESQIGKGTKFIVELPAK